MLGQNPRSNIARWFSPDEKTLTRVRRELVSAPGLPFTFDVIPAFTHGILDYVLGVGAIAAPYLSGFASRPSARLAFQLQGGMVLAYSLITNYRLGVARVLPFRTHLLLDLLAGGFLAVSPRLFGYRRGAYLATFLAMMETLIVLLSRRYSETEGNQRA